MPIVDHVRLPEYSPALPLYTCLPLLDPACVLTMSSDKSLKMDLHASRLVGPVTEYSAKGGSSGFSKEPWPLDQLLDLRQGSSAIEENVTQFCETSDKVHFDEVFLKDIFRFGLSEPVKSWLPERKFNVSLNIFIDYALMVADSAFTVGVVEVERDTVSVTEIADAPERTHKMVATATGHIISATHESGQVTLNCHASSLSIADLPESRHVSADLPESLHVSADLPESLHVSADPPESHHVSADPPVSSRLR